MTMSLFCSGELIRDPERKTSTKGTGYVTALLKAGEELLNLSAFDSGIADRLASLKKGAALAVSGRLQARPYTDRDGTLRAGLSVTVTELMVGAAPPQRAERRPRAKAAPAAGAGAGGEPFDDDIAF